MQFAIFMNEDLKKLPYYSLCVLFKKFHDFNPYVKVSMRMNCGELLIIGGAEDKCLEGEVLNKFVELAYA